MISAHWEDSPVTLGATRTVPLIYDFYGFPARYYQTKYAAPGAPDLAKRVRELLPESKDAPERGLDHGAYVPMVAMYPEADIPVLQLSMDYSRAPEEHYALAQQLRGLRDRGVLIVGSGNIVHNLRQTQRGAAAHEAYDWALEFDQTIGGYLQQGNLAALPGFLKLGQLAKMAHPTHDHYLPLLYAAGAVDSKEAVRFFNTDFQAASISMRSAVWG